MSDRQKNPLGRWSNPNNLKSEDIVVGPYYNVPPILSKCNLHDAKGRAKKFLYNYLGEFPKHYEEGRGVFFFGQKFGTGKSGSAVCILKRCIQYYLYPYFIDCGELIKSTMDRTEHPDTLHNVTINDYCKHYADVLIIDDLKRGSGKWGNMSTDIIEDILKTRANSLRPTIITANKRLPELREDFGGAVCEIITSNCIPVELVDEALRSERKKENDDYGKDYIK